MDTYAYYLSTNSTKCMSNLLNMWLRSIFEKFQYEIKVQKLKTTKAIITRKFCLIYFFIKYVGAVSYLKSCVILAKFNPI